MEIHVVFPLFIVCASFYGKLFFPNYLVNKIHVPDLVYLIS